MSQALEGGSGLGGLTAMQEQIWWLHRVVPRPDLLNMFYALQIDGPLDAAALERTLLVLGERHQPLRTTYSAVDGVPAARVGERPQLAWEAVDVDGAAQAARRAAWEAHGELDLASGPLLRATLVRLAGDRHVLLLTFHHVCADGWSLEVFCREASAVYAALRDGRAPELAELDGQCVDHALWQACWLAGEPARREVEWWREYLRGLDAGAFELPLAGARPGGLDVDVSRQVWALPPELSEELGQVARRRGASLYMVFLAAAGVLIARWTGRSDVVVGTLAANRETASSSGLLGAHFNPILMRTDLGGDPCLGEVLMRVVESALPALEHQGVPFSHLGGVLAELGIDPRASPVPAVTLLQDRYPLASLALAGADVTPLHLDEGGASDPRELVEPRRLRAVTASDLTFFLRESGDRHTLSVFYKTRRLGDAAVRLLIEAYSEILLALVEELDSEISQLDLALPEPSAEPPSPPAESAGAGRPREPVLFPITTLSPVDALSPVLCSGPAELARLVGESP